MARASTRYFALLLCVGAAACVAKAANPGFDDVDGGGGSSGSSGSSGTGGDGGENFGGDGGTAAPPDGSVTVTTTIYANTDDSLYTLDPKTHAITLVGKFAGNGTDNITDVAVNGNGEVFVNSQTAVYKAALPSGAGSVQLTKLAGINTTGKFFALAFAPAGVLGPNEALVGGDGDGELWFIDQTNGAIKDLGGFGNDPRTDTKHKGHILALSGDIVFYTDANKKPTGLATIRSCTSKGTGCETTDDFLVGIDMTALSAAYTGSPAASLLSGIYGGSGTNPGNGIGFGDVFGLGVWGGDVYGFSRNQTGTPPTLLTVDTSTGKGAAISGASFSFSNGWSGAGVTTKVTVTVPPPPPIK